MRIMLDPSQIEELIKGGTITIEESGKSLPVFSRPKKVEIAFSDIGYQRIIDIASKGLQKING